MMKISLQGAKIWFWKAPGFLAEHAFIFTLFLVCIALVIAAAMFYFFAWIPQQEPAPQAFAIQFNAAAFEEIIEAKENRHLRFEEADTIQVSHLFALNRGEEQDEQATEEEEEEESDEE